MRKLHKNRRNSYSPLAVEAYHEEDQMHNAYHNGVNAELVLGSAILSATPQSRAVSVGFSVGTAYLSNSVNKDLGHIAEAAGHAYVDDYWRSQDQTAQNVQNVVDFIADAYTSATDPSFEYGGVGGSYGPDDYNGSHPTP